MLFSKQLIHCVNCGVAIYRVVVDRTVQFCSEECREMFDWKHTLSIMGKAYYPKPETIKGVGDFHG